MKPLKERKTSQTPKVELFRSNSYFDPKKLRNLYTSHSKHRMNGERQGSPKDKMIEIDKLKDDIIKLKNSLNKRVKEISTLQIDNLKLDEENKNLIKVIDEIINDPKTTPEISYSVNKFINNGFNSLNDKDKEKTQLSGNDENLSQVFSSKLTQGQYIKLKDAQMINNQRKQISQLTKLCEQKEEEIDKYKENTKIAKYQLLESEHRKKLEEYLYLRDEILFYKNLCTEKEKTVKEAKEEMEYYKVLMNKMKIQVEDLKEKNKLISQKSESLTEELKSADEKINQSKYNMNSMRKSLLEKDQEFIKLKEQVTNLESFGQEKEKMEKRLFDNQRQIDLLKRELESSKKKVKDQETQLQMLKRELFNKSVVGKEEQKEFYQTTDFPKRHTDYDVSFNKPSNIKRNTAISGRPTGTKRAVNIDVTSSPEKDKSARNTTILKEPLLNASNVSIDAVKKPNDDTYEFKKSDDAPVRTSSVILGEKEVNYEDDKFLA